MYSSVQFLKYAKSYVNTKVSDQAVAELQEVSANPRRSIPATIGSDQLAREEEALIVSNVILQTIEKAVHEWLNEYPYPDSTGSLNVLVEVLA
jgi:hypothetical protein